MDKNMIELRNKLHQTSMEIEYEIDKSDCDKNTKNLIYSATKPYEHLLTSILDYLESIS